MPVPPNSVRQTMVRLIVIALALLLYLVSLALPAFDLEQGDDSYYIGFVVVLFGALSYDPRWLANPLWLIGIICLCIQRRLAALLALASASVLSLLCLTMVDTQIAQNASGVKTTILKMGLGYCLWLASILVPTAFAVYFALTKRESPDKQSQSADNSSTPEDK